MLMYTSLLYMSYTANDWFHSLKYNPKSIRKVLVHDKFVEQEDIRITV